MVVSFVRLSGKSRWPCSSMKLLAKFGNIAVHVSCEMTMAKAGVSGSFLSRHQIKVSPTCIDKPGTVTDLLCLKVASALQAMNSIVLGSKQLVVYLHEPSQLCQEKLAHRFGSSSGGHPCMH